MKFLNVSDDEWDSPCMSWTVRRFGDGDFTLYYSAASGLQIVGDFPTLDLASKYADHLLQHTTPTKGTHE